MSGIIKISSDIVKSIDHFDIIWDSFYKNEFNRITFDSFFRRFVEAHVILESLVNDYDQTLLKRFA
jgi:hypothetical protein